MRSSVGRESRRASDTNPRFPAYGPIEGALGYVLFYVLIDRVTPAIVTVFSETVLDLSPSFIRFGLATVLWVFLVLFVIDQTRRQLAALGVVTSNTHHLRVWSRVTPSSVRTAGYIFGLVAGTVIAMLTFDRALEVFRSLVPIIVTVAIGAFDPLGFFEMIVFFLSYSIAAQSLDRLVIDGLRILASA